MMKIRYRGPSGGGSLEVAENALVSDLNAALKAETGSPGVMIKFGWPPQTLAADQNHMKVKELGLNQELLTVVPLEESNEQESNEQESNEQETDVDGAPAAGLDAQIAANLSFVPGEQVQVEMPESHTHLVLRVMADDGDCMFTALGGALGGLVPAGAPGASTYTPTVLRRMVVDAIRRNPVKFGANFLGSPPKQYCDRMLDDMWGGAIELSILSDIFAIEIYTVDVKTGTVYQFGEQQGYKEFCVLVYSGIHYDRLVEVTAEAAAHLAEFDVTRWDVTGNGRITQHAGEICEILHDRHYYTSTSDFIVTCDECHEIIQGEKGIAKHARETGHVGVTEIKDSSFY